MHVQHNTAAASLRGGGADACSAGNMASSPAAAPPSARAKGCHASTYSGRWPASAFPSLLEDASLSLAFLMPADTPPALDRWTASDMRSKKLAPLGSISESKSAPCLLD